MTKRNRNTPGPALPPAPAPTAAPPPSWWERVYANVTPAEQERLLALARAQGVVHSHQLPAPANGVAAAERCRRLTAAALAGQTADWQPVRPSAPELFDADLDGPQREAVAKALHTPDFCLVRGPSPAALAAVAAEVVSQAAARGERVLLLAASSGAADRVLHEVGGREVVFGVRCLAPGEDPRAVPPGSRPSLLSERVRVLAEGPRQRAEAEARSAGERETLLAAASPVYQRLEELAGRHQDLEGQLAGLRQCFGGVPGQVEADANAAGETAGPFADAVRAGAADWEACRQEAATARAKLAAEEAAAARELSALAPDLEAARRWARVRQERRWWTARWWKACLSPGMRRRLAEIEPKADALRRVVAELREKGEALDRRQKEREDDFERRRQALLAAQVERRERSLRDSEAALLRDRDLLEEKWRLACRDLPPGAPVPSALSGAGVASARGEWREALARERGRAQTNRELAAALRETAPALAARLPALANLVVATVAGLSRDEHFADAAAAHARFDVLVLLEADRVGGADFLRVAPRARRWVLLGQPPADVDAPRPGVGGVPRPAFFEELWRRLSAEPGGAPVRWRQENGRLCCRLRPVGPEEQRWVTREQVADAPDIELRILAPPRVTPALAEVVFPPSTTVAQAKQFLFCEADELAVEPAGRRPEWAELADRLVLSFDLCSRPEGVSVQLPAGIREVLCPAAPAGNGRGPGRDAWRTARLEFDRAAGWDRARAEEFAYRRLGLRDLGRTAWLPAAARPEPLPVLSGESSGP